MQMAADLVRLYWRRRCGARRCDATDLRYSDGNSV